MDLSKTQRICLRFVSETLTRCFGQSQTIPLVNSGVWATDWCAVDATVNVGCDSTQRTASHSCCQKSHSTPTYINKESMTWKRGWPTSRALSKNWTRNWKRQRPATAKKQWRAWFIDFVSRWLPSSTDTGNSVQCGQLSVFNITFNKFNITIL